MQDDLDKFAIEYALENGEIVVPEGLSRDERHDYLRKQLFLQAEERKDKFIREFFGEL